jgi:Uma2 family endonuclease
MTPKTLLSVEEFAALPDDGMKHELNEGELIVMPHQGLWR